MINRLQRKENFAGFLFVLPNFSGFLVFSLFPVIFSLGLSFTEWDFISGFEAITFNGVKNYTELFKDEWFIESLKNTLIYSFSTIPLGLAIGLFVAVLLDRYVFKPNAFKMIVFLPYISSIVASAVVWSVLLQPSYGPMNEMLMSLGIQDPPKWFGDMKWALPSIIAFSVWQGLGYNVLIFLAGLKGIPEELYDAAKIDGANRKQQFWTITRPLLSPTTFFLLIMGMINSFKVFDQIKVITDGGPGNSTSVLAYYMYKSAFEFFKMGYASAIAWVMFALIFIVTIVQWRSQKKMTNVM